MVNKIMLIGYVGKKKEKREANNNSVIVFTMATNEHYRKDGNLNTITEWHNIVSWGRVADFIEQYVDVGDLVFVEGRLRRNNYITEKKAIYSYLIYSERVTLLKKKRIDDEVDKDVEMTDSPKEDVELTKDSSNEKENPNELPFDVDDSPKEDEEVRLPGEEVPAMGLPENTKDTVGDSIYAKDIRVSMETDEDKPAQHEGLPSVDETIEQKAQKEKGQLSFFDKEEKEENKEPKKGGQWWEL